MKYNLIGINPQSLLTPEKWALNGIDNLHNLHRWCLVQQSRSRIMMSIEKPRPRTLEIMTM